jgi:hypothetical protein
MAELLAREAQEPALGVALQQDLRDRERNELRGGDLWASACTTSGGQEIIHQHIKCGEKVVEVSEHEATSVVDVAIATLTFDDLSFPPGPAITAATNSESLI